MSIVVYWLEAGQARGEVFAGDALAAAMARAEALRAQGAAAGISHVCIASELPGDMTRAGVAGAPEGYDWTKRRGGRRPR